SKKHLCWLLPLAVVLLLVVTLAVLAGVLRSKGLHWQGLGWHNGPQLSRVWWQEGDCQRLQATNVRLQLAWPLQVQIADLRLPACAATGQGAAEWAVPPAPPFNVRIQAVRYHDYAPL